jgi:hypothetical protein
MQHNVEYQFRWMSHNKVFEPIPPRAPPDRGFEHIIELEEEEKHVITTPYRHPKSIRMKLKRKLENSWTWATLG